MTSKERAKLKKQAMSLESIFQIGKMGVTPQTADALRDALKARELIKINVLKNCDDELPVLARTLSERTGAEIVQVIGRKIVLYKKNPQKEKKKKPVLKLKRRIVKKERIKTKEKADITKSGSSFKDRTLRTQKSRRKW